MSFSARYLWIIESARDYLNFNKVIIDFSRVIKMSFYDDFSICSFMQNYVQCSSIDKTCAIRNFRDVCDLLILLPSYQCFDHIWLGLDIKDRKALLGTRNWNFINIMIVGSSQIVQSFCFLLMYFYIIWDVKKGWDFQFPRFFYLQCPHLFITDEIGFGVW